MRRLPSVLARMLTSGTGVSPGLPDMSEGKEDGCGRFNDVSEEFVFPGGVPSSISMVWIMNVPLSVSS